MPTLSDAVTRYIENAAPFAQPILTKIRKAYHEACPDVVETMKWSFPHFEYKGVLGNMAAFKQHVSWGFWKAQLMNDPHGILAQVGEKTSMGGSKVSDVKELPSEQILVEYIREAMRLNDEGIKKEARPRTSAKAVDVPEDFVAALEKATALPAFEAFSPSHKREYVEWITEAKQEATRQKRMATAVEWIGEGKSRNWKYERKK